MTEPVRPLEALIEYLDGLIIRWRRQAAIPAHGSAWVQGLDQGRKWCADDLEAVAALLQAAAPPAPTAECGKQVNTGTGSANCRLEVGHGGYCSSSPIKMRMAAPPAPTAERYRFDQVLRIAGLVNGYHNDGTTLTAAETLKAVAEVLGPAMNMSAPPERVSEGIRCPECRSSYPERIAGLWLCNNCGHEWDDAARPAVEPREEPR